jgi:hypothetical protein
MCLLHTLIWGRDDEIFAKLVGQECIRLETNGSCNFEVMSSSDHH